MNKENVQKAIAILDRVPKDKLDMTHWQARNGLIPYKKALTNEKGLLSDCGTTACLAGWVAVSPEFQESGGSADKRDGRPVIEAESGEVLEDIDAIAYWFGIDTDSASVLCYRNHYDVSPVESKHVIERLKRLLEMGDLNE